MIFKINLSQQQKWSKLCYKKLNFLVDLLKLTQQSLIQNQCMYTFSYWHTYYDSAFISLHFKIPNILYFDLQISNEVRKWPSLSTLPSLSKVFQLLQEAMLRQDNWIGCLLNQKQMEELEYQINLIVVNLQCEKAYAEEFWQRQPRRVQSSIVHFYLYFKMFISKLIPADWDTVLETSRKEKLAFSLKQLEALVNNILPHLKMIHQYMFQPVFAQEQRLVKQFFQEFVRTLQNLPKISKQKLRKTPKLMEFICLVNPLEAQKKQQSQSTIRRKNATAVENKSKKEKRISVERTIKGNESEESAKNANGSKVKEKNSSFEKSTVSFSPPKDIAKQIKLFRFKQNVRKYSIYKVAKKPTVTSYATQDRTGSIQKQRPPSNERSMSFLDHYQIKRSETQPYGRPKQTSIYNQRKSRQTSSKSIYQREKSKSKSFIGFDNEEVELERQNKVKKKKGTKVFIKTMPLSNVYDVKDGKRRGWGFVVQWFQGRLAKRKLQKLMNEV